jgi:hypothetical protein
MTASPVALAYIALTVRLVMVHGHDSSDVSAPPFDASPPYIHRVALDARRRLVSSGAAVKNAQPCMRRSSRPPPVPQRTMRRRARPHMQERVVPLFPSHAPVWRRPTAPTSGVHLPAAADCDITEEFLRAMSPYEVTITNLGVQDFPGFGPAGIRPSSTIFKSFARCSRTRRDIRAEPTSE